MPRLLVLFVTAFVDMVGLTMIIPLLPFYATRTGCQRHRVGLLVSAFSVAQLAVAPLWGRFSDRYGRRPAILAGLLLTACAYVIFAFAGSLSVLLLSRLVQGLGGGTIGVVQAYVADASPPEQRTKSLGWLSAVTSLGAVAGPAFGSVMISIGGRARRGSPRRRWRSLVAGFAARFLVESRQLGPSGSHAAPSTTSARQAIGRVLSHWHEPASRLIWIYTVGIGAFYGTIQVVPLLLMNRLGVTEGTSATSSCTWAAWAWWCAHSCWGGCWICWARRGSPDSGLVLLAAGLGCTGVAAHRGIVFLGFTLMPLRHRLSLPLRHRAPVPGGAGQRARALHGGPAHLRRRIAGAVPGRRGRPDGPLRGGGAVLDRGTSGARYAAVRLGAGRIAAA